MQILKQLSRFIIEISFNLSVWVIELFYDMSHYEQKLVDLKNLPEGTLGNDIAKCLDFNKLRLIPNFESHDLKHVLLDFKMTPEDEIRMQAFMLGNGNYTIPCFTILVFGALLLPDKWLTFYKDFESGQNTEPISNWTLENYANLQTVESMKLILKPSYKSKSIVTTKAIAKFGAFASIIAGLFGMCFCLPFLFSSSLLDLIGAGFPFVGGAVLTVGGLLSLSNLSRPIIALN